MRAMAASLKQSAVTVASSGRGIQNRLHSLTFEGPAADRFRDRMLEGRREAATIAADANELANDLLRAAAAAEIALAEWEARVIKMQEAGG